MRGRRAPARPRLPLQHSRDDRFRTRILADRSLLMAADGRWETCELLPCGLQGSESVDLFLKPKSPFFWYDFTVRGERYRGPTKESDETRAAKVAALKLADAIKGSDPLDR